MKASVKTVQTVSVSLLGKSGVSGAAGRVSRRKVIGPSNCCVSSGRGRSRMRPARISRSNLLAEAAQSEPTFTLRMGTEVTGLLREGDKVVGMRYRGPDGTAVAVAGSNTEPGPNRAFRSDSLDCGRNNRGRPGQPV